MAIVIVYSQIFTANENMVLKNRLYKVQCELDSMRIVCDTAILNDERRTAFHNGYNACLNNFTRRGYW